MRKLMLLVVGCCLAMALLVVSQSVSSVKADDSTSDKPIIEIKPDPNGPYPISATYDVDPQATVSGEGVTSYTNYGWLSPDERKAFMRSEGYSSEYVDSYFEREQELFISISSGKFTKSELDKMLSELGSVGDVGASTIEVGPDSMLVESVVSMDGVYATCANYEVNNFGGSGGIGSFKSEIVKFGGYAYVTTGGCSGSCAPFVTHPTPISYSYGRATFTGSSPYFTFHNAYCQ